MKNFKLSIFLIFSLIIFSCAKKEKPTPTAESAYLKAYELLKDKSYSEAAKEFEKIEDDFPFSKWASKAQIMAAYAHYKYKEYNEVIRVVDDFIRINPADSAIDYMTYLKAMCYYNQIPEINRAQDNTKLASITFRELVARFPDSEYANDAREKIIFVDEHLAGAKMSVGRYQIDRENYIGAIENFQDVADRYHYTNQAPESYYRLVETYHTLGLSDQATKANQLLQEKFADNEWAQMAQKLPLKNDEPEIAEATKVKRKR